MPRSPHLSDPIALRVPLDILKDIETVAEAADRTRSWVIVRALKAYLAGEGGEILMAAKGRREIAEGLSHDIEDVLHELEGKQSKDAA